MTILQERSTIIRFDITCHEKYKAKVFLCQSVIDTDRGRYHVEGKIKLGVDNTLHVEAALVIITAA